MTGAAQKLTVRVPLAVRKQRCGSKLVMTPASTTNRGSSAADTTLVKALARAFRWRRMMETGRYVTIDELAPDEKAYYGRPIGVTLGPDGSLLLADDVGDVIWRVTGA